MTNNNPTPIRLAVFGSLKQGFYNHPALEGAKPIEHATVRGAMFLCGSYPHLYRPEAGLSEELYNDHEVEIYEVSPRIYKPIERMEHGAGYSTHTIELNGKPTRIFFTNDESSYHEQLPHIEGYTRELLANRSKAYAA